MIRLEVMEVKLGLGFRELKMLNAEEYRGKLLLVEASRETGAEIGRAHV